MIVTNRQSGCAKGEPGYNLDALKAWSPKPASMRVEASESGQVASGLFLISRYMAVR